MPDLSAAGILGLLGPVFLGIGAWRAARQGVRHPQARAWLIIGTVFSAVAWWLHRGA